MKYGLFIPDYPKMNKWSWWSGGYSYNTEYSEDINEVFAHREDKAKRFYPQDYMVKEYYKKED